MTGFNFSFSGDDIEDGLLQYDSTSTDSPQNKMNARGARQLSGSAFPIEGQNMLHAQAHSLDSMLENLPPRISYKSVKIDVDNDFEVLIPRRELWDVRLQLMEQDDDQNLNHLGGEDVKTGIYEGGFKSWESSGDLVKVLFEQRQRMGVEKPTSRKILEVRLQSFPHNYRIVNNLLKKLGCGTALPSLYEFQHQLHYATDATETLIIGLSDYNPAVLQLVTLPNLILSWAFVTKCLTDVVEGQLEIDKQFLENFRNSLNSHNIRISFFSGGWGRNFVTLVEKEMSLSAAPLKIIGAETIYSAYALWKFSETLRWLLKPSDGSSRTAIIAAKSIYFGVGGSIEEFTKMMREYGFGTRHLKELSEGVGRVVLEVSEPEKLNAPL